MAINVKTVWQIVLFLLFSSMNLIENEISKKLSNIEIRKFTTGRNQLQKFNLVLQCSQADKSLKTIKYL